MRRVDCAKLVSAKLGNSLGIGQSTVYVVLMGPVDVILCGMSSTSFTSGSGSQVDAD